MCHTGALNKDFTWTSFHYPLNSQFNFRTLYTLLSELDATMKNRELRHSNSVSNERRTKSTAIKTIYQDDVGCE